ncbi:MAG TPA: hypothetical protein QF564_20330 [Pirellulaceae bacterium]|nr:hypothetical protein [Pirellulaceae bacterium]
MCQRGRLRMAFWISVVLTSWTICTGRVTAQPSLIGRSKEPIQGAKPEDRIDEVRAGRFLIDPPTLENLGFRWYVSGDGNRNATVTVAFRKKGESDWTEALPMLRIYHEIANQDYEPYRVGNLFAGSVLFLKPDTKYEARFTMRDPDGGAPAEPMIVSVATRSEPATATGKEIHANSRTGLMAAYAKARPGDVILLHAGVYSGPFRFSRSGEPGRPIVFRGAGDGEAILQADGTGSKSRVVSIAGTDYLMFEDLTFRSAHTAIYSGKPGSVGITIRRCRIKEVVSGINTQSENSREWYIADNEIVGINQTWYPRPEAYMSPAHTGVNVYGRGHVVCYNRISRFSDSLAIANFGVPVDDVKRHCVAIDFYGNDLSWAQDDTIEADYGCHNVRVYRNRCYNTHTALSTQPFYGGPVYLIRNEAYSITAHNFKLNNYPAGILAYNNTVCCAGQGFTPPAIWQNGHFRNNLFMGGRGYAMETGSPTPYSTLDYNGYRRNSVERFIKWIDSDRNIGRYQSIAELTRATGLEQHGLQVDYNIFTRAGPPQEGKTYMRSDYDLRLKPQANCVDAGALIPQVTSNFSGTAPDLGCYEYGQDSLHYGPRKSHR